MRTKLIDFNSASDLESMKDHVGTPTYMAPEILPGHHYDSKVDLWSFGVMIVELFCSLPIDGDVPSHMYLRCKIYDSAVPFLASLLYPLPIYRQTAADPMRPPGSCTSTVPGALLTDDSSGKNCNRLWAIRSV
jgi:serine/threonine protein kinase